MIPAPANPLQSPPAKQGNVLDCRRAIVGAVPRREAGEREYVRQIDSASLEGNGSAVEDFWCDDSHDVVLLLRTLMKLDENISKFDELLSLTSLKARGLRAVVRCISLQVKCSQIEAAISRARSIMGNGSGLPRQPPRHNPKPADRSKNSTELVLDGPVHGALTTNMATGYQPACHEGSLVNIREGSLTGGKGASGAKSGGSALLVSRRLVPAVTAGARSPATHGTTTPGRRTFMLSKMALSPQTTLTAAEPEQKERAHFLTDVVMHHGSRNRASHGISSNNDTA